MRGAAGHRLAARAFAPDHRQAGAGPAVTRHRYGSKLSPDAWDSFAGPRFAPGPPAQGLPVRLEEITCALAKTAYGPVEEPTASERLAVAGFQAVGAGVGGEGHPAFAAHDGRRGSGGGAYRAAPPGAASGTGPARPDARREHATFTTDAGPGRPVLVGESGEEGRRHRIGTKGSVPA
ncbi:hypothetical protein [Streptomyces sp. NPDC014623]|uniref:hypothetical protein n=1 Tax=Streptomyces sp. NPDC014623 TaxID=3364875 RepID=UPI0037032491